MAKDEELSLGSIRLRTTVSEPSEARVAGERAFRILVIRDFSGRGQRAIETAPQSIADRRPVEVNRDNFDQVMAKMGVHCELGTADQDGSPLNLTFRSLADFHPDALFRHCRLFLELRSLREKLQSPATFDKAAAEVRAWGLLSRGGPGAEPALPRQSAPMPAPQPDGQPATNESAGDLLDQAIRQTEVQGPEHAGPPLARDLRELIRQSVAPLRVERPASDQADLIACVDRVAEHFMQVVLHSDALQELEAGWRSLDFLVKRLRTGGDLKLYVLDLSLAELAADFGSASSLEQSRLHQLLVEQAGGTRGGETWNVVVADFTFGWSRVDLFVAGLLSKVASRAGVPVLAAASPYLFGAGSFAELSSASQWRPQLETDLAEAWATLRHLPEASHLALLLPRFLLRVPYGLESNPIKSFPFEELSGEGDASRLLWGNSAYLAACLLAEASQESESGGDPQLHRRIDRRPLYIHRDADGTEQLHPGTEVPISDQAAAQILELGLMPVLTVLNTDQIDLSGWRSVSAVSPALAGMNRR